MTGSWGSSDEAERAERFHERFDEPAHGTHRCGEHELEEIDRLAGIVDRGEEQRVELRYLFAVGRQFDTADVHHLVAETDQLFAILSGIGRGPLQSSPRGFRSGLEVGSATHFVVAQDRVDPETVDLFRKPNHGERPWRFVEHPAQRHGEHECRDALDELAWMDNRTGGNIGSRRFRSHEVRQ